MIGNFLNLSDVGIYTAVYSIASRPFLMIGGILSGFFRPILFQEESKKDFAKAQRAFKFWIRIATIIFLIGILIFITGGNVIIDLLLAKSYAENAYLIFIIIGTAYAFVNLTQILENRILSFGKSNRILLPSILSVIVNLSANYFLIPKYGIQGAALATLIAFVIQFLITFYIMIQISQK